jgi:hypothetical protein
MCELLLTPVACLHNIGFAFSTKVLVFVWTMLPQKRAVPRMTPKLELHWSK